MSAALDLAALPTVSWAEVPAVRDAAHAVALALALLDQAGLDVATQDDIRARVERALEIMEVRG